MVFVYFSHKSGCTDFDYTFFHYSKWPKMVLGYFCPLHLISKMAESFCMGERVVFGFQFIKGRRVFGAERSWRCRDDGEE